MKFAVGKFYKTQEKQQEQKQEQQQTKQEQTKCKFFPAVK